MTEKTSLRELIRLYGTNSHSFLTLYPGYEVFQSEDTARPGSICYVSTPSTWVGAAEPYADPTDLGYLLLEFAAAARKAGKSVILLPVSSHLAHKALLNGYGAVQIGAEPKIDLTRLLEPKAALIEEIRAARVLEAKGAVVVPFRLNALSSVEKTRCEDLRTQWMASRKTDPLGFLNRVEPWTLGEDKRYFLLRHEGQILAYLAAVPIWATQGWYLVDLIRDPASHAGTTELLILGALNHLKNEGAREISLGFSPLARLDRKHSPAHSLHSSHSLHSLHSHHSWLHWILVLVFHRVNFFYGFKSLYNYKQKFRPHIWEPLFLIFADQARSSPRFGLKEAQALTQTVLPLGLFVALRSSLIKRLRELNFFHMLASQASPEIILRAIPTQTRQVLWRMRMTLLFCMIMIGVFVHDSNSLQHAYFLNSGFSPLLAVKASLFHWNIFHLIFNLLTLLLFCGFLEVSCGSLYSFVVFAVGTLVSNPIAATSGSFLLKAISTHAPTIPTNLEQDVGTSVGIFACIGAFAHLMKKGWQINVVFWVLIISYAVFTSSILGLNHLVAFVAGALCAKIYLPKTEF